MKTVVPVKVEPYLAKYIKSLSDSNGVFNTRSDKHIKPIYTEYAYQWEDNIPNSKVVYISLRSPSKAKIYGLIVMLKKQFRANLLSEALINRRNYYPVRESLICFLRRYRITESEYSMERAYKVWQRSQEYKILLAELCSLNK